MAHFAQLDENNVVLQVIVVSDNDCLMDGKEDESVGIAFCKSVFGVHTNWAQTSYNAKIRKNYAGIGYVFDSIRQAFIPPKPYASWLLDEETCRWKSPVEHPQDGKIYAWDEATTSWIEITL